MRSCRLSFQIHNFIQDRLRIQLFEEIFSDSIKTIGKIEFYR